MSYDFSEFKQQLTDVEDWLREEYKGIRTGRAAPSVLDHVMVEAYGARMPINQTASITTEDARTIRIDPWDKGLVKAIESALDNSDLGLSVNAGEDGVRVSFPELTTERRDQLLKLSKQKLEEARKSVRTARDEVWDEIQRQEKNSAITEDDKYRFKDEMEELVQQTNKELEAMQEKKEKEISE